MKISNLITLIVIAVVLYVFGPSTVVEAINHLLNTPL